MEDTEPIIYNTAKWIEENQKYFLPPVCNKMMHSDGQMKSFFVGGPNQRKDYHIEEGEELFYMLKGDMCLKVVEQGCHRDVHIKEGEIFLLPGSIAHSPQRQANTVGLVIERDRPMDELDGLRYYIEKDGTPTLESLYEEWFHCEDLGSQLGPIIKRFFASEQCKTGKPIPGSIPETPPVKLNSKLALQDPFNFHTWIKENRSQLETEASTGIPLFQKTEPGCYQYQFQVSVYGVGENTDQVQVAETFIWMIEGSSAVTTGGKTYELSQGDNMLIKQGQKYTAKRPKGSVALICYQDPTKKRKVE